MGNRKLPATGLSFLIAILLILGIFFRFINLDRKVYWHDETLTSLTNSGYTRAEMLQQDFNGRVMEKKDLQKYQRTNAEKSVIDTIQSLAIDFPEHSPLYYVMSRLWVQLFGNSVAVTRSLSATISLLAFPCMYWLCLELFNLRLVGLIAVALLAISPFHVLYAQEAREYSLWTVTILLSSAALLRAMRLNTLLYWGIYAFTVTLGMYSYAFSVFITIAHGFYVAITKRFNSKTFSAYLITSIAGIITFAPWLLTIVSSLTKIQKTMEWTNQHMPLSYLVGEWIYNISYVFADFWYIFTYYPSSPLNLRFGKYLVPIILILVGYALYFLCRRAPKQTWLFVVTLIAMTALPLMLPDLIKGGYRSTQARYLIPCYIGIQLAVAYLLATQINAISNKSWQRKLWQVAIATLISAGILSCAVSSQAETWWNKRTTSYDDLQVAGVINKASSPLLLVESGADITGGGFTLSYLFDSKVRMQVIFKPNIPNLSNGFSDIFLYEPSKELRSLLEEEQNYKTKLVYKGRKKSLWQLKK